MYSYSSTLYSYVFISIQNILGKRGVLGRGTSAPKFLCKGTSVTTFSNRCGVAFRNRLISTYNIGYLNSHIYESILGRCPGFFDVSLLSRCQGTRFRIQICMEELYRKGRSTLFQRN